MSGKPTPETAAKRFALSAPVGTECVYYPSKPFDGSKGIETRVRSEPWILGSGHIVVKLDGMAGGRSIEHIVLEKATTPNGVWTDERVELLKRLWHDGSSYSEIASALGGGISRSAVAGKVLRLGLGGRKQGVRADGVAARGAKSAQTACAHQPRKRSTFAVDFRSRAPAHASSEAVKRSGSEAVARSSERSSSEAVAQGKTRSGGAAVARSKSPPAAPVQDPAAAGFPHRAALVDLRHDQCHWPVGDPRTPGFFFCGAPIPKGACTPGDSNPLCYCLQHARLAYDGNLRVERWLRRLACGAPS